MKDNDGPEVPPTRVNTEERHRKRDMRRVLTFGVIMATAQMGILLYFVYC